MATDPVGDWARARGVPTLTMSHGNDPGAARRLSELHVDYGCIATFPARLGQGVLDATGDACINLHSSLLPRHRGANPLFWTYHAADPAGGVTVHIATAELDGGPILSSARCAIGRGEPVEDLHNRYAALGGPLVVRAIESLADGSASPCPQDESGATSAPRVDPGKVYSRLDEWGTERAWHFLAGMAGQHQEPFVDERGRAVRYSRVLGFETLAPREAPGSVTTTGSGWSAWATDGVVHLAP